MQTISQEKKVDDEEGDSTNKKKLDSKQGPRLKKQRSQMERKK
jgi:hypothetical protein